MIDPALHDVKVQETSSATPAGAFVKVTRYTFYIGNNGPFSLEYPAGQDHSQQFTQDVQAKVNYLRSVGALA